MTGYLGNFIWIIFTYPILWILTTLIFRQWKLAVRMALALSLCLGFFNGPLADVAVFGLNLGNTGYLYGGWVLMLLMAFGVGRTYKGWPQFATAVFLAVPFVLFTGKMLVRFLVH